MARWRAGWIAKRIRTGLRREQLPLDVVMCPEIVDGVWTLRATLSPEIDRERFLAGTVAENVRWLPGEGPRGLLIPFGLDYSEEEQEQLVLVAAKVLHYLLLQDVEALGGADAAAEVMSGSDED